ncbi:3-hydroxyanthranilate 3,4-dioxygenase [Paraburkholderia sp. GV068]|nr:3-hydroxyanthranilate 3,4-dioxygenase [Paraburkholderia sp. GV072]PUA99729.1 3-hydroxyanthranilate 3,4-dioxygenase [Paraburkholderia sp. GV068]
MNAPLRMRRKNAFNLLREAEKLMSFDEFPLLRSDVDPQLHASRNEIDQPFHVVCAKDCVVVQISGKARITFAAGAVRYFDLEPGDHIYVPAGSVHRILTVEKGIQIRYKARDPGHERVMWLCDSCGHHVGHHEFDATSAPAQAGYHAAVESYNSDPKNRTCEACGHEHAPFDLSAVRWDQVAQMLLERDEDE